MLFAKNTMKPAAVAYYPMTLLHGVLNVNVCTCTHERTKKISCILNLGCIRIINMYTCKGV